MSDTNKTYRIRTDVNADASDGYVSIDANLIQDYDTFDILSVKINSSDTYRLHNANYGVVVGRVLANNGFGIPNAKLSIFISSDSDDADRIKELYPFTNPSSKNVDGVRYNLLPDEQISDCHQIVGTFPNKRYMLDNDVMLEVFDKYYKFTTRTNNAGDYLFMGIPVGAQTLHMDLDLSDCGILSQRPRDFVYKGYTIEQFENPNKFKSGTDYNDLSQVFSQDQVVNVRPFWGNESLGETLGITRADINVAFTFQPTCVFMGCIVSDNSSQGITKKCQATEGMGNMEELVAGEGTIEMIRKTPSGDIEQFQVKGNQLINANGVWCYQIPMNLDYMMTDEYGNLVPTDNPDKGIPTRASVRFRISMQDNEENVDNYFRTKVLVPHNPQNLSTGKHEEYDYEFGSKTRDDSFRDLFWNNVYSVKSFIPRFQKRKARGWKDKRFTGIKNCSFFGTNNPIPYNNIRIKLPLMFAIICILIKIFIFFSKIFNTLLGYIGQFLAWLGGIGIDINFLGIHWYPLKKALNTAKSFKMSVLSDGLCPDIENWYFAPILTLDALRPKNGYNLLRQTLDYVTDGEAFEDTKSIAYDNKESDDEVFCITTHLNYVVACIEMNLAMEYRVINFDFYNDWINGLIYIPRFMRIVKAKKTFLGNGIVQRAKIKACMDDPSIFAKTRRRVQQCSLYYSWKQVGDSGKGAYSEAVHAYSPTSRKANNYHKKPGFDYVTIFGRNGGICHEHTTSRGQNVYYMKPCEWNNMSKINLYATDIILLGSLNKCDENGIPQAFRYLSSSSYVMPTNLALTNMETNGPLYANNRSTMCTGNGGQPLTGENIDEDKGIQLIPSSGGLSSEIIFHQNNDENNDDIMYEPNELSDLIAVTESAGISWNYNGPGQGSDSKSRMYFPGGHFLGLSCVNSQTNIKSCINLERICELGVNMSQRKEEVLSITESGTTYVNIIPTGFISGDDIVADDFRSMFATMNKRRLIATRINPETGYKMYDFAYARPINFEGAFTTMVDTSDGNPYNKFVSNEVIEDKEVLKSVGINVDDVRPDGETWNSNDITSITKTVEDLNLDYYAFRLGLEYEDLTEDNIKHKYRFLIGDEHRALPQYENSYYFYFGIKEGSTALDEFNIQFFTDCGEKTIATLPPSMGITKKLDFETGKADVTLVIDGMEPPYEVIKYYKTGDMSPVRDSNGNIIGYEQNQTILKACQDSIINFTGDSALTFGEYTFVVTDVDGVTLTDTFSIADDVVELDFAAFDFNVHDCATLSGVPAFRRTIFQGGYFNLRSAQLGGNYVNESGTPINWALSGVIPMIVIKLNSTDETVYSGTSVSNGENLEVNLANERNIFIPSAGVIYDVYEAYVKYAGIYKKEASNGAEIAADTYQEAVSKYPGTVYFDGLRTNKLMNGGLPIVEVYNSSYMLKDGNDISLNIGWKNKNAYVTVKPLSEETKENVAYYGRNWWKSLYGKIPVSAETREQWFAKAGIIKTNTSADTFSSGVFSLGADKFLWGIPQNDKGLYSEDNLTYEVIDSNKSATEYAGYTLDDRYSYVATPTNGHYSSVAVNNTLVSGDYIYIISGETKTPANKYSDYINGNNNDNSGYVFKQILLDESGNTLGHTLDYKIDGVGVNDDFPSCSGYGVIYPSFKYPVFSKPLEVKINSYLWSDIQARKDGSDATIHVEEPELTGVSELTLKGGITYRGKFGELNIPNFNLDELENIIFNERAGTSGTTGTTDFGENSYSGKGYYVTTEMIPELDYSEEAYLGNLLTGSRNMKMFSYDITNGYPVDENGKFIDNDGNVINTSIISNMLESVSDEINLEDLFSKNIRYNIISKYENELFYQMDLGTYNSEVETELYIYSGNTKLNETGIFALGTDNDYFSYYSSLKDDYMNYVVLGRYDYDNTLNDYDDIAFIYINQISGTSIANNMFNVSFNYRTRFQLSGESKYSVNVPYSGNMGSLNSIFEEINSKAPTVLKYVKPLPRPRILKDFEISGLTNNPSFVKIDNADTIEITPISGIVSGDTSYFTDVPLVVCKQTYKSSEECTINKIFPLVLPGYFEENKNIRANYHIFYSNLYHKVKNNLCVYGRLDNCNYEHTYQGVSLYKFNYGNIVPLEMYIYIKRFFNPFWKSFAHNLINHNGVVTNGKIVIRKYNGNNNNGTELVITTDPNNNRWEKTDDLAYILKPTQFYTPHNFTIGNWTPVIGGVNDGYTLFLMPLKYEKANFEVSVTIYKNDTEMKRNFAVKLDNENENYFMLFYNGTDDSDNNLKNEDFEGTINLYDNVYESFDKKNFNVYTNNSDLPNNCLTIVDVGSYSNKFYFDRDFGLCNVIDGHCRFNQIFFNFDVTIKNKKYGFYTLYCYFIDMLANKEKMVMSGTTKFVSGSTMAFSIKNIAKPCISNIRIKFELKREVTNSMYMVDFYKKATFKGINNSDTVYSSGTYYDTYIKIPEELSQTVDTETGLKWGYKYYNDNSRRDEVDPTTILMPITGKTFYYEKNISSDYEDFANNYRLSVSTENVCPNNNGLCLYITRIIYKGSVIKLSLDDYNWYEFGESIDFNNGLNNNYIGGTDLDETKVLTSIEGDLEDDLRIDLSLKSNKEQPVYLDCKITFYNIDGAECGDSVKKEKISFKRFYDEYFYHINDVKIPKEANGIKVSLNKQLIIT